MLTTLKSDARAATGSDSVLRYLAAALRAPEMMALVEYRLGRGLRSTPVGTPVASLLHALVRAWSGVDIHPAASIGPGALLVHGVGIVIGPGTCIGAGCRIYQGVTLGQHHSGEPTVGNNVTLHPGAKAFGAITIGDRSHVGANAVLMIDVPSDHTATGVPVRHTRPTTWS